MVSMYRSSNSPRMYLRRCDVTRNWWCDNEQERDCRGDQVSVNDAGKLFNSVAGSTLRELEKNQELARLIEQYNNTYVREGQVIPNSNKHVTGLIKWINTKFKAEMDKRKSEKGRMVQQAKLDEIMKFSRHETKNLL